MTGSPIGSPLPRLSEISRCFQGVIPSIVATSDGKGTPNVTYVSQVFLIDDHHVALSCQFFNKTRQNLDENPYATVQVCHPATFEAYELRLRFDHSETSGPLFDSMSLRIQAIASHTGMEGVFRLIAADVFEVLELERVDILAEGEAEAEPGVSLEGLRTELRGLQWISERIASASDLEQLLDAVLEALDAYFGFRHTMALLYDEPTRRLLTMASRGYGESGVGAEVPLGQGLIGTAAQQRRIFRITGLDAGLRYGRAIRREVLAKGEGAPAEIPLPGLCDAQSALVMPLHAGPRLVGVLAAESRDPLGFGEWHEAYLEVIGNQIALGIDRMLQKAAEEVEAVPEPRIPVRAAAPAPGRPTRTFVYFRNDDCVFVDGEYLIRNVPGRILWKLLGEWQREGRTSFTNRELRLDETLGLPKVKDNLESRLILLRRRLKEKCGDVQIVPTARGRFSLSIEAPIELLEK
ncbi:MAG TPA: GAF domain-containing protein [Thermoanaerobaculia bacterium]